MIPDTLAIVFGAGGRLGAPLLPRLTAEPISVFGIARQNKPATWPRDMHWTQIDVTNYDKWPHSLGALVGIAGAHQRVVLVDLLLDRTTVTAMRRSIAAVTAYILRLCDRLAAENLRCSLVSASTTATLAPWPYQTPYGLAKRRQLTRYATSGLPGAAFLLPSLIEAHTATPARPWSIWTYDDAAERLVNIITPHAMGVTDLSFRLVAPRSPTSLSEPDKHVPGEMTHALARCVPSHVGLLLHRRDSPGAHREASHYRLALTPTPLRRRVDHHHIPPHLVQRLGKLLDTPTETVIHAPTHEDDPR